MQITILLECLFLFYKEKYFMLLLSVMVEIDQNRRRGVSLASRLQASQLRRRNNDRRNSQVETKAVISALENVLKDYSQTSAHMVERLDNIERQLASLEQLFYPLSRETEDLVRAKRNLADTVDFINEIAANFDAVDSTVDNKRASFSVRDTHHDDDGLTSAERYCDAVSKLVDASSFLKANGSFVSSKSALDKVSVWLEKARKSAVAEFGRLLRMHGPAKAQYLIMKTWASPQELLTPTVNMQLRRLGDTIEKVAGSTACIEVYVRARAKVAAEVIERAAFDLLPKASSNESTSKRQRSRSSIIRKLQRSPARKSKASSPPIRATPLMSSHTVRQSDISGALEALFSLTENVFATEKMLSECVLTSDACRRDAYLAAMNASCDALKNVLIDDILTHVQTSSTSVDACFMTLSVVAKLRIFIPSIRALLVDPEYSEKPIHSSIESLDHIKTAWEGYAKRGLSAVLEEIEKDQSKVPTSGTVSRLSSVVLNYLRRILNFRDTVSTLRLSESAEPLSQYVASVVVTLQHVIGEMAKGARAK